VVAVIVEFPGGASSSSSTRRFSCSLWSPLGCEPNGCPQREPPNRSPSASAEPPPGSDALEGRVRRRAFLGRNPSRSLSPSYSPFLRPLLQRSVRPPLLKGRLLQQLLAVTQITARLATTPSAPPFAEAARLPFTDTPHGPRLV